MTFQEDKVGDFLEIFEATKSKIRGFQGCLHLELLKDINQSNIFFTYSHWQDESCLDDYRNSDTFRNVWSQTKALFSDKPLAFSLKKFIEVNK